MGVCLKRRVDSFARLSLNRKATWNAKYIHFNSFVLLKLKRKLIRCSVNRAQKFCTEVTIEVELLSNRMHFGRTAILNVSLRKPWGIVKKDM